MSINGKALTGAQIDTQVQQQYVSTIAAVDTARAQLQTALVSRRNEALEARDFCLQLKKAVVAHLGTQSPLLVDFGLAPAKTATPKTSAEQAVIEAKKAQTRQARGTRSEKQNAAIQPGVATPAVLIGPDAKPIVIPGTAQDGQLPAANGAASPPATRG